MTHQEGFQERSPADVLSAGDGLDGVLLVSSAEGPRALLQRAAGLPLTRGAQVSVALRPGSRWGSERELQRLWADCEPGTARISLQEVPADVEWEPWVQGFAAGHRVDLVLASPDRHSLRGLLFGSLPARLARHLEVPLLLAKPKRAASPYRRVLVGADFGPSTHSALLWALRLCSSGSEGVELVHVADSSYALVLRQLSDDPHRLVKYRTEVLEQAQQAMRTFLRPFEARGQLFRYELRSGDPAVELCRRASEGSADLIVVGKQNDAGPGHTLLGDVSEQLLRRAHCDVLVVPPAPVRH